MIASIRRIFFWLHLSLGLTVGLVIAVLAITGTGLAFKDQALRWADRAQRQVLVPAEAVPQDLGALLDGLREQGSLPGLSAVTVGRASADAIRADLGGGQALYIDPYRGVIVGPSSVWANAFFRQVEDLHRWFALQGQAKAVARQVKAAANAAFLVMIISGIFLWWPRQGRPAILRFKRGAQGKARDFNWHHVLGLWFWVPIFTISLTGLVMAYPWANDLLYRVTGNAVPARPARPMEAQKASGKPSPEKQEHRRRPAGVTANTAIDWDAAFSAARAQAPDWSSITLRVPRPGRDELSLSIVTEDLPPPRGRGLLTLKASTAEILRWEPYASQNWGRKLRLWARWTHTGQSLGLLGELLMAAACLSILVLVWTGFALSWRRFFSPKSSNKSASA